MSNLFVFRRDFRLIDNLGLNQCLKDNKTIPIFIFSDEQVSNNKYFSNNSFSFLIESLSSLEEEIKKENGKLYLFFGNEEKILKSILKNNKINKIYTNKDWTPYAKKRDEKLVDLVNKENKDIKVISVEDYNLLPMGTIMTTTGKPYEIYTPFFRKSKKFWSDIPKPKKLNKYKFDKMKENKFNIKLSDMNKYYQKNPEKLVIGGREEGLKKLSEIKNQQEYSNKRNILTYQTSLLSAYLKYGCISIRECFYKFKDELKDTNELFNQLFWREFYWYIINYHPQVLHGQVSKKDNQDFQEKYKKMKWENNKNFLNKWKKGETGFPIVDAGIKELLTTGYMHNRSRLISSSFLIKLCLVDWREGEKFFAQHLTDYDPSQNNGGWQFHHGGASNADYFRIISPISQGKRFDKNAEYIKKWLPNLKDIPAKELIDWEKYFQNYDLKKIGYVEPMFSYKDRRELSLKTYKSIFK